MSKYTREGLTLYILLENNTMPKFRTVLICVFLSSVTLIACAQTSDADGTNLLNRENLESKQQASESQQQRHAKSMGTIRNQHQQLHDNRLETSRQETDFLLKLVDRLERLEKRLDEIEEKMRLPAAPHN